MYSLFFFFMCCFPFLNAFNKVRLIALFQNFQLFWGKYGQCEIYSLTLVKKNDQRNKKIILNGPVFAFFDKHRIMLILGERVEIQ